MRRGSVAVICPFAGTAEEGMLVADRLLGIRRAETDTIVLVDNTPAHVLAALAPADRELKVVHAADEQSSYHARNVGVEATESEWILFIDADCIPTASILDDYLAEPVPPDCGVLAGAIVGVPAQQSLPARWARHRGVLDQERLAHKKRPFGATANLMVRREAMRDVGGFHEGIRSGGDVDLCWRLQEAGWSLAYRDLARVEHVHRDEVGALVRQYVRYGAGRSWLERRYRDEPRSRRHFALLAATPILILGNLLKGRRERAGFRFLDAAIVVGGLWGRLFDNRPSGRVRGKPNPADAVLVVDGFPTEDALNVLSRLEASGRRVWVEAARRSSRFPGRSARTIDASYLEDDGALNRLADLGWLALKHPLGLAQAITSRRPNSRYGAHEISSRARRIAARNASVAYCRRDEPAGVLESERIGDLIGIRVELVD